MEKVTLGVAAMLLATNRIDSTVAIAATGEKQPNIIFIMIDDLGWMDLACQGNNRLDTPNIDRLASQGMRFTDAYAAAPVCSPTRAAIMTGQSPARLGLTTHIPDRLTYRPKESPLLSARTRDYLPLEQVTLAERLKEGGYATAFIGKWHLSGIRKSDESVLNEPDLRPEHQGFDLNIGGCAFGGPPTYFDPYRIPNITPRQKGEYLPDRLADEAITFMKTHKTQPFFIALWNYTVHWPMEAPQKLIDKYTKRVGPGLKDARYGAMIEAMDKAVGRVLKEVDELGLTEDTLVIFTSDNGGYAGVSDSSPLRESKGHLYEGGIRVPMILRWPGVIRSKTLCNTPVISTDFYPTLLDVAGLKPTANKKIDGESLMPLLSETGSLKRKSVCFHYPNYAWHRSNRLGGAIRSGDYKLLKWYEDGSVELYNLKKDISEKVDLSESEPKKATQLKSELESWLSDTGAVMPKRLS